MLKSATGAPMCLRETWDTALAIQPLPTANGASGLKKRPNPRLFNLITRLPRRSCCSCFGPLGGDKPASDGRMKTGQAKFFLFSCR